MAEGVQQLADLDSLLRCCSVSRAWLYDAGGLAEITRQEIQIVAVRHLSKDIETGEWPTSLLNVDGFDFVNGTFYVIDGKSSFRVRDSFSSAALDPQRARNFEAQHFASGRPSVWVVTSRRNEAIAKAFVHMLLDERERRDILLIGDITPDERLARSSHLVIQRCTHGCERDVLLSKPEVVIDLSCRDDPSHVYAAMVHGTEIPLWRPAFAKPSRRNGHLGLTGYPLATLTDAFLRVTRGMGGAPIAGLVQVQLDLDGVYNRFASSYTHLG